jgi:excisionase family DNA binding protein
MAEQRQFYTVEEVATMLRVSKETIRRLIAEGRLEGVRVGHQVRISKDALDKFLGKR